MSIVVLEHPCDYVARNGHFVSVYLVNLIPLTATMCISQLQGVLRSANFVKDLIFHTKFPTDVSVVANHAAIKTYYL